MAFAVPSRPRWCDVKGSSSESLNDSPPVPLLAANSFDSYCEAPDQDLAENSDSMLNQRMGQVGSTTPMKSTNFIDDRKNCEVSMVEHSNVNEVGADSVTAKKNRVSTALHPNSINPANSPVAKMAAAHTDFSIFIDSVAMTPVTGRVQDGTDRAFVQASPAKRRIGRKRNQSATTPMAQAPMQKHPRAGESSASINKCMAPNATCSLPKPSEKDWLRRIEKRKAAVVIVKASQQYKAYQQITSQTNLLDLHAPRTPDPTDRAMSKRQWEEEVRLWRLALRQHCPTSFQYVQDVEAIEAPS